MPALPVIRRLPKYYRYLREMHAAGVERVSSSELARMMGTTASQVRQDFNCFGGYGQQGIGYDVANLLQELELLLFQEEKLDAILIGAGSLGCTIAKWINNEVQGYRLTAVFDADPALFGQKVCDTKVLPIGLLGAFCAQNRPQVAVLCVPREAARTLSTQLIESGITGFLNFSHFDLSVGHPDVVVENIHLGDSMMSLGYRVRKKLESEKL